jgi:four helix bundle protein
MLNIAEGTSRFSNKDRKNFFVIVRGSAFECVAILEYLLVYDFSRHSPLLKKMVPITTSRLVGLIT